MLELSECITETMILYIKSRGHRGEENNHISDPLLKSDKYTNYGHTERILKATDFRELIAPQEEQEFRQKFSIKRPILNLNNKQIMLKEMKKLTKNADKYKIYLEVKSIIVKILFKINACWYPNPGGFCNEFIKNICPKGSRYVYISQENPPKDIEAAFKNFL
jgi:hypothetical protein